MTNSSDSSKSPSWFWACWLALAATYSLFAISSFLPAARVWGLNHLAFYPPAVRLSVLIVSGLFLVPPLASATWRAMLWLARPYLRGLATGHNALALSGVASFVAFAAFRSATMLLGDGRFIVNTFKQAASKDMGVAAYFSLVTVEEHIYPATELLNYTASWTASRFGATTSGGVWILSCAVGAAAVVGVLVAVRRADWPDGAKLAVSALALLTGAIQLFFGYIEHYTPVLALGGLYAWSGIRALNGQSRLWKPGAILLVATLFHVQALLLVPSYVWLLAWAGVFKRNGATRLAVVVGAATVLAAVGGGFIPDIGLYYMPPLGASDGYRIFSVAHLADALNEVALLCPMWLLYAVLVVRERALARRPPVPERVPATAFAWMLAVPAVLFLLLFRPELGMARDWDLFGFTVVGLAAPGLLAFVRYASRPQLPDRAAVISPAVIVSAAVVLSWVGVNADTERSVARYRAILQYDLTNPGYAYEILAQHFEDRFQFARQVQALSKAYETSNNPRYLYKTARVLNQNNDLAGATKWFRSYLEARPEDDNARKELLGTLATQSRVDEMITVSLEGIEYSPNTPEYHFFLGNAYLAKGMTEEGLKAFAACSRLNPPPNMVQAMNRLMDQAGVERPESR